jgi:hypothetical protein
MVAFGMVFRGGSNPLRGRLHRGCRAESPRLRLILQMQDEAVGNFPRPAKNSPLRRGSQNGQLCLIPPGSPSRQLIDADPIDDRMRVVFRARFGGTGKPPFTAFVEQLLGATQSLHFSRIAMDLAIPADDEDRTPVILVDDLIDLDAHARVLPHEFDFLTDHREPVDAVSLSIEREMDRDDVGLVEVGIAKSSQIVPLKDGAALGSIQFVDQHGSQPFVQVSSHPAKWPSRPRSH